jgi:hypothetical protein
MPVLHVLTIDVNGGLWHTARRPDGSWLELTDVVGDVRRLNAGSADPGPMSDIACSGVGNDLQICATTASTVIHTIRTISGPRMPYPFPFGDLLAAAGAHRGVVSSLATAGDATRGTLDVSIALQTTNPPLVSTVHSLYGAVRLTGGAWKPFVDRGGSFDDIASALAGSTFHYCGVTFDSQGLRMNHLEHAVGTYPAALAFGDVGRQVLLENPGSLDPGSFHFVSCAAETDGRLHICTAASGRLFHTIRRADGTWSAFGDVVAEITREHPGAPAPAAIGSVGCAVVGGELHLTAIDAAGVLWHTIRHGDGSWSEFGDVLAEVAREHPGSAAPNKVSTVAVADSF